MKFLEPQFLWFLLTIPVVMLFYFMKLKRKPVEISTTFLWKDVLQQARVDSFFYKLRTNILLLLQIIFLFLLIFALAKLSIPCRGIFGKKIVFVLENSASMGAYINGKSRWDVARDKIKDIIDKSGGGSSFMIIEASNEPKIVCGFTKDKGKVKRLLFSIPHKDVESNLLPVMDLVSSVVKTKNLKVFLVGDKLGDFKNTTIKNFEFIPVGKDRDNVGIIRLQAAKRKRGTEIFVKVKNFSKKVKNRVLEVYVGDNLQAAYDISLPPQKAKSFVFSVPANFYGLVNVKLSGGKDALPTDDRASVFLRKTYKKRVLIIKGSVFLEKFFSLLEGVEVFVTNSVPHNLDKYDLIVWNGVKGVSVKRGKHIFINCTFQDSPVVEREVKNPVILNWDEKDPILSYVSFNNVLIFKADIMRIPPYAKVLLKSDKGGLIFLIEKENFKGLYITFDIEESDWPLSYSYPIFFYNAAKELSGFEKKDILNFATGERIDISKILGNTTDEVYVRYTNGNTKKVNSRYLSFSNVGVYQVSTKNKKVLIPINLLKEKESNLKVDSPMRVSTSEEKRRESYHKSMRWGMILLSLGVLMLEWFIFSRGF